MHKKKGPGWKSEIKNKTVVRLVKVATGVRKNREFTRNLLRI